MALAAGMAVMGIIGPHPFRSSQALPLLAADAAIGLLGLRFVALGRRNLELGDDTFSITTLFARRVFRCSDFSGYRHTATPGRFGYVREYWLAGKPDHRNVTLLSVFSGNYSADDIHRLRSWLDARYPDLEAADQAKETRERTANRLHPDLAARSPLGVQRARVIAKASRQASLAAVIIVLTSPWLHIASQPGISIFTVASCSLLPIVVGLKLWQPDAFQLGSFVGRRLPASLDAAFFVGSLVPVLPAVLYFRPLRWTSPIPAGLVISALLGAPLLGFGLRRFDRTPGVLGGALFQLVMYGFAAATALNGALDVSRPSITTGVILDREVSRGRGGPIYTLDLQFEKPERVDRSLRVPRDVYDRARVGYGLGVFMGHGALGIPWIRGVFGP